MRILAIGVAPWVHSAYGKQFGYWLPRFAHEGHTVLYYPYRGNIGKIDYFRPDSPRTRPIKVLPQGRLSQFGFEILPHYVSDFQPDVILSLTDLFLFDAIKGQIANSGWPWYHWSPIDCSPLGAPDYNIMNITGIKPVAMSAFGRDQLEQSGFSAPLYVPHSIDTALFIPPIAAERSAARRRLHLRDGVFVIGMNAANESSADRKAFSQQLSAFASFHARHPSSVLYLHTIAYRHPIGLDLPSMLARLGLSGCVIFPGEHQYNSGSITDQQLRSDFYWSLDLYSAASKAEGFCLPVVEAQACGLPVVASNNSTFPEVCAKGEYGARLVGTQPEWSTLDSSYWATPLIDQLEDAYEMFHLEWRSGDLSPYAAASRRHSLQFDHDPVWTSHWQPALSRIEKEVSASVWSATAPDPADSQ